MRHLATVALTAMLFAVAVPAGAVKPTSSTQVTWMVGNGTVTLDTTTNEVTVLIEDQIWVQCFGADALATVQVSATTEAEEVVLGRHGRSGSFSATIDYTPTVIFGACDYVGDSLTTSVSGIFETDKGKAERWRDGRDRYIQRTGTGVVSVGSALDVETDVLVMTTITR